jgi:hypothetical protein
MLRFNVVIQNRVFGFLSIAVEMVKRGMMRTRLPRQLQLISVVPLTTGFLLET